MTIERKATAATADVLPFPNAVQRSRRDQLADELSWARRRRQHFESEAARYRQIEDELSRLLGWPR